MWKRRTPTILVVEDDVNNHPLFKAAYEKVGFKIIMCLTAEGDFAKEVASFNPDIISMDLMIAKEGIETQRDGFDAIRLLKANEQTKDIPIVVVSNFTSEERILRAKDLGAIDYFNLQGYSLNQIAKQIRTYVDKPKNYHPSHPLFRT